MDGDKIGFRKVLGLPPAVDWHAVARDAAIARRAAEESSPHFWNHSCVEFKPIGKT